MCHPFAQPICEDKSFEPDHLISSQHPIRMISNSDHQFLGTLIQKKKWPFQE